MARDILASSKKIRRKRGILRFVLFLTPFILLAGGFIGLSRLSYFRIHNININAENTADKDVIKQIITSELQKKILFVLPGDNIFFINGGALERAVKSEMLRIDKINVSREWPDGIIISSEERETRAVLCGQDNKCYLMSDDGILFDVAPEFQGTLILKIDDERDVPPVLGYNALGKEELSKIIYLKENIEKYVENNVRKIIIKPEDIYELHLNDWYIKIDKDTDQGAALANFTLALYSEIKDSYKNLEYMDLRFGNKVFYKYK